MHHIIYRRIKFIETIDDHSFNGLPQLCAREPFGGVTVQTDHVLPGVVGSKGELALAAVHLYTN